MSVVTTVDIEPNKGIAAVDNQEPPGHGRSVGAVGAIPWLALVSALGVLIVAVGFARGRSVQPWSAPLFWVGEVIVLAAPTLLLVRRRTVTVGEGTWIAVILAAATYAIKVCYFPIQFTFSDEFQHLSTLQSILTTHHLYHVNPNLSVSPYFPGLEIQTASLSTLSHLSAYASATVVLGVAHLVTTLGLFYFAIEVVGRPRVAALAVVLFALGGNYQFFTTYFAYESLGLPLVIVAALATVKALKVESRNASLVWAALGLVTGAAAVVTHHVSSYALVGIELSIALVYLVSASGTYRRLIAIGVAASTAGLVVIWDLAVATPTYSYLRNAVAGQLSNSTAVIQTGPAVRAYTGGAFLSLKAASGLPPPFQHYMGYLWAILLTLLLAWGLWLTIHSPIRENRLLWAMALLSPGVVVAFAAQVLASGGAQIGTRLLTFMLIPGSIVCAHGLESLANGSVARNRHSRRNGAGLGRQLVVSALLIVFVVGAIALGYPPYYATIPGPYLVGGRSRSVDSYGLAAALWAKDNLPPGNRFAADIANAQLIDSVGEQTNVNGISATLLILSSTVSPALEQQARKEYLVFVVVDSRISQSVPVAGNGIFPNDPFAGHYAKPVPSAALKKFDDIPGVSRMYDNGPIVIYNVKGSAIAPAPRNR